MWLQIAMPPALDGDEAEDVIQVMQQEEVIDFEKDKWKGCSWMQGLCKVILFMFWQKDSIPMKCESKICIGQCQELVHDKES